MKITINQKWQFACLTSLFSLGTVFYNTIALADLNFGNKNLLLGNPSGAIQDINNPNNYLILKPQYVAAYDRDKGIINWVSWQLDNSWLGTLPRSDFRPDKSLPKGWYQVTPNDYSGSGFDRGHMVPAADRDKTAADSTAVFLMTNILPQAPDNNQGPWQKLETYCRELALQGKHLYIIAGPSGSGGTGRNGTATTIAKGKVAVPAETWKIIVVMDKPVQVQDITPQTRVIAVSMPNKQGINKANWKSFRVSVRKLEEATGYNFLSNVPIEVQDAIEMEVDKE